MADQDKPGREQRRGPRLRLQLYSFRFSQYQRTSQSWRCGNVGDHQQECSMGPDSKGRCRASFECIPQRKGARWHCTRPSHRGGPCNGGPLPDGQCFRPIPKCRPIRSIRLWRRLISRWILFLSLAVLAVVLFGSFQSSFISPGKLSFQHAPVQYIYGCGACHSVAASTPSPPGWIAAAVSSADEFHDSKLCVECHRVGKAPFAAHGIQPHTLRSMTRQKKERYNDSDATTVPFTISLAHQAINKSVARDGKLQCRLCHLEHRGKDSTITAIADDSCNG